MEQVTVGKTTYWVVHTTEEGFQILVAKGVLPGMAKWDFRIKYRKPNKSKSNGYTLPRMPKHIHMIVELYAKYGKNPELTMKLRNYFLSLLDKVEPVKKFPPTLRFFDKEKAKEFEELNEYGEFSAEFLMVFEELLMMQEKTNYPKMTFHRNLLNSFADGEVYKVINIATHRGR